MQHMMNKTVKLNNRAPQTIVELLEIAFRESKGNFCISLIDGKLTIKIGDSIFVQGEIEE